MKIAWLKFFCECKHKSIFKFEEHNLTFPLAGSEKLRFCPKALHFSYQHNKASIRPWSATIEDEAPFFTFVFLMHICMATLATVLTSIAFIFLRATQKSLTRINAQQTFNGENAKLVRSSPEEPVSYFQNEQDLYDDNGPAPATSTSLPKGDNLVNSKSFLHQQQHTYEAVL